MSEATRNEVKQLVYGLTYGMGASTLAKKMNCTLEKARGYLDGLRTRFPQLVSQSMLGSMTKLLNERGFLYQTAIYDLLSSTCLCKPHDKVLVVCGRNDNMLNLVIVRLTDSFSVKACAWRSNSESAKIPHKVVCMQHQWTQDVVEECKKSPDGCVRTIGGRLRHIPRINIQDGTWAGEAERKARNTVPQGSAADIAKTAMILLHKQIQEHLRGGCNILLMVCSILDCMSKRHKQAAAHSKDVLKLSLFSRCPAVEVRVAAYLQQ